ncbi:MAG: NAD(P)-dependent oxidoreductase [Acidobacteria bacterium]|nr:NAD(P)-dependent oxidoreductase [Acidobacteriota bacterium]
MLTHLFPEPQRPSRVLILGANGFIARNLAEVLEREQIACRRVGSGEVDLIGPGAVEKLGQILAPDDAVVVTSALTPDKGRDPATLMKNLRMAETLCAAFGPGGCAHVIYISSDAVYDWRSSLINEQSSCEPSDLYAVMHIGRERMLGYACQAARIPYAVVRPCAIYGAGDTHNSYGPNRFLRTAISEGKIRLFGQGEEQRDHVWVRDVAEILKLCLLYRSAGVVNAVSGKAVSFYELAQRIISVVGRGVALEFQPRNGPVTHRHFDISLLARAFPAFQPIPLEVGIAQVAAGMSQVL